MWISFFHSFFPGRDFLIPDLFTPFYLPFVLMAEYPIFALLIEQE
jgi:hypothetical protein